MKDYYKILEVDTSATEQEIKKSFRRLALKYHPDKTNNNKIAEAKFKEVQEAYKILSNTSEKRDYDNKVRQAQTAEKETTFPRTTPQTLLQSLKKLRGKIKFYDEGRIDQKSLYQILRSQLSSYNVSMLKEHDDIRTNRLINEEVLRICQRLDFFYAEKVSSQLKLIALHDRETLNKINSFLEMKKRYGVWEKYRIALVLFIAMILCIIIYMAAS